MPGSARSGGERFGGPPRVAFDDEIDVIAARPAEHAIANGAADDPCAIAGQGVASQLERQAQACAPAPPLGRRGIRPVRPQVTS